MMKLVLFDFDGTIADTLPLCLHAFQAALTPYAGHMMTVEEISKTFGYNEEGMIHLLVPGHEKEALADYLSAYERLHGECSALFDGIPELFADLKSNGMKVCLVTGKGEPSCAISLRYFGLENTFDAVRTGSPEGDIKAKNFVSLIRQFGFDPAECVYVGDAVTDVTESQKAGIACYSACWSGTANRAALEAVNPGRVLGSLDELRHCLGI